MSQQSIKTPNQKVDYTPEMLDDLVKCIEDPLYFIKTHVQIQHPKQGSVPFIPFDFQEKMINSYHNYRYSIILSSRQMGKSVTHNTIISQNNIHVKIKNLIKTTFKEKIISFLEDFLLKIVT